MRPIERDELAAAIRELTAEMAKQHEIANVIQQTTGGRTISALIGQLARDGLGGPGPGGTARY